MLAVTLIKFTNSVKTNVQHCHNLTPYLLNDAAVCTAQRHLLDTVIMGNLTTMLFEHYKEACRDTVIMGKEPFLTLDGLIILGLDQFVKNFFEPISFFCQGEWNG